MIQLQHTLTTKKQNKTNNYTHLSIHCADHDVQIAVARDVVDQRVGVDVLALGG